MIHIGDCRELMHELGPVDAIVTDPPYEIGFMGRPWDKAGVTNDVSTWASAFDALRPGGYLLAFGGTRTAHRMVCAIEDAGFEIRDTIAWLYGSGFPKHKTILKPAFEPITVARRKGPGGLNTADCMIPFAGAEDERESKGKNQHGDYGTPQGGNSVYGDYSMLSPRENYAAPGRWPANVILDELAGEILDQQAGPRQAGANPPKTGLGYGSTATGNGQTERIQLDGGGPSRFFYCPKAGREERNAGLDGMPVSVSHTPMSGRGQPGLKCRSCRRWKVSGNPCRCEAPDWEQSSFERPETANHHPTVKPIELMRWLIRLCTPSDGTVLDPFAGSGTTGIAAGLEGRAFVGIELDSDYADIAQRRIAYWAELGHQASLL